MKFISLVTALVAALSACKIEAPEDDGRSAATEEASGPAPAPSPEATIPVDVAGSYLTGVGPATAAEVPVGFADFAVEDVFGAGLFRNVAGANLAEAIEKASGVLAHFVVKLVMKDGTVASPKVIAADGASRWHVYFKGPKGFMANVERVVITTDVDGQKVEAPPAVTFAFEPPPPTTKPTTVTIDPPAPQSPAPGPQPGPAPGPAPSTGKGQRPSALLGLALLDDLLSQAEVTGLVPLLDGTVRSTEWRYRVAAEDADCAKLTIDQAAEPNAGALSALPDAPYKVCLFNGENVGETAVFKKDTTPPAATSSVLIGRDAANETMHAMTDNDNELYLIWSPVADVASYKATVFASTDCSGASVARPNASTAFATFAGTPGGIYTFQVRAVDAAGNEGPESACSTSTTISAAGSGDLDGTFGSIGFVERPYGLTSKLHALAVDSGGYIYAAGGIYSSGVLRPSLMKIDPQGSLVNGFGTNGVLTVVASTCQSFQEGSLEAVTIDVNGKIVVAGWCKSVDNAYVIGMIVRLNPDGTFDQTFTSGGYTLSIPPENYTFHAVTTDSFGQVYFAGHLYSSGDEWVYGKLTAGGVQAWQHQEALGSTVAPSRAQAIYATSNFVWVGGYSRDSTAVVMKLIATNGLKSSDFDTDGVMTVTFGAGANTLTGITRFDNGKLVATGGFLDTTPFLGTAVFSEDSGTLDPGYHTGGLNVFEFDGNSIVGGVAKSATAMYMPIYNPTSGAELTVGKLSLTTGALVPSFGGSGVVGYGTSNPDRTSAVALTPDGMVVVGGTVDVGAMFNHWLIMRVHP